MRLFWLGAAWLAGIALGRWADLPAWYYLIGVVLGAAAWRSGDPSPEQNRAAVDRSEAAQPRPASDDAVVPQPGPSGPDLRLEPLPPARPRLTLRGVGPFVVLASLGAFRLAIADPSVDTAHVASYNDLHRPVELVGVVVDYPDVRDQYVGLRLEVEQVELVGSGEVLPVGGLILVQADRYGAHQYGDRLLVSGYLETPPEDAEFSYREYLARQGVYSLMPQAITVRLAQRQANPLMQAVFGLRQRAFQTIHALFPDPEASLLAGILLGLEAGIGPEVREAFNATGTTHIIAISGFNLTVLAALVIGLFGRWLGIRRGAVAAAATIGLYTLLVGADAAVVRAAIMGGLALFARFLGRRAHAMASLAAAAVVMTAVQPLVLWDVGFQLSFAATLGLVLYADPIQQWFVRIASGWMPTRRAERLAVPVGEYLLFTLAAQITTLPLTMAYFQRLSLSALLANPLILPAQPPLMILGGLATLAGLVLPPLGKLLALLAWPFPAFTVRVVSFMAELPSSSLELGPVAPLAVALLYAALFGATWVASLPARHRPSLPRPSAAVALLGLTILAGLTWREVATRPDGKTHLTVFDAGNSLLESPHGRYVLIGGGDSAVRLSQQLGRRLPLLHRQLDWLIVTDTREPHVRGLVGVTERYRIRSALIPGLAGGTAFRSVLTELQSAGVEIVWATPGHTLQLGPHTRLHVLERDEIRLSLLLVDDWTQVVLPADSVPLTEAFPEVALQPTALVLHRPSSSDWLTALRPALPISTGPTRDPAAWPLRTQQHGWIELVSDGRRLWVQSQFPADLQLAAGQAP